MSNGLGHIVGDLTQTRDATDKEQHANNADREERKRHRNR